MRSNFGLLLMTIVYIQTYIVKAEISTPYSDGIFGLAQSEEFDKKFDKQFGSRFDELFDKNFDLQFDQFFKEAFKMQSIEKSPILHIANS